MKDEKFSIMNRIKSFKYAFAGLKVLIQEEHNARIHLLTTLLVIITGFLLDVSTVEWAALVLAIGLVISLEAINAAIENIANFVSPEKHEMIKKIKDLSAGAVLVGATTAIVIGAIIFIPKIMDIL